MTVKNKVLYKMVFTNKTVVSYSSHTAQSTVNHPNQQIQAELQGHS